MGDKCDIKDGCSLSELWFLMVKFRICFFFLLLLYSDGVWLRFGKQVFGQGKRLGK